MMAKSRRRTKRSNVTLHDVEFVNKDLTAEFEVPELQKMSYSRRIILMKGIGVFKSRKRTPTSTNTFFETSLPQRLLARKRRRIHKMVRQKPTSNKLSSIVFFIFLIILLLQIIHSCDLRETLAENETQLGRIADIRRRAQTYLAHVYGYAEKPLKSFRDQLLSRLTGNYIDPKAEEKILLAKKPRIDLDKKRSKKKNPDFDKQVEGSLKSGSSGANLINTAVFNNRFTSAKLFRCLATRVSSNPKNVKSIRNENVACIVSIPSGGDTGVVCTSKLLCCTSGGRPISSCSLGKVDYINPVRAFVESRNKNCWKRYLLGGTSSCVLSVKTKSRLLELLSKPICKIRLEFMSLSIIRSSSGYCMESLPNSRSAMVVPIVCNGEGGKHKNLDLLSSPVTANDVKSLFSFLAGTDVISWNIVMFPSHSFYLDAIPTWTNRSFFHAEILPILRKLCAFRWDFGVQGNATRVINNQRYTVCFSTELISEKRAEKMKLPVQLAADDGSDDFFVIKSSTNVASAFAVIQADVAAVAAAAAAADD